jgi:dipeptidase
VLVTPGASADGNPMIAYNADSGALQGMLYHYPASTTANDDHDGNNNNSVDDTDITEDGEQMRSVYNWDTGVYLGEIPEAKHTYNVVGNTNCQGLVIAETTFGGLEKLSNQPGAKIDYGSLIYITLQRARTAREAITTMGKLMDAYGYASEGESFSIADRNGDVFIMEVIGRGSATVLGAAWVAVKIPDGMIAAHSNQARIRTFPRDNPDNCLFSDDVIDLAKEIGAYQSSPDDPLDLDFSFSDVYDPVTFMGSRASEARTWSIFSALAEDDSNFQQLYEDYAIGKDLTNRMPLYIKPKAQLTLADITAVMSNHYEGTALDFSKDVGAGEYGTPYRARPLTWSVDNVSYHNERAVATQQTGWNFIAQIRLNMPSPFSSLLWFAVDDSSTAPRYPVYGCSSSISDAYYGKGTQDGEPSPLLTFDMTKAFWVQNMVSNFVYSRWNVAYPMLQEKLDTVQKNFQDEVILIDEQIMALYDRDPDNHDVEGGVEIATNFSVNAGDRLHREWFEFYGKLFAKFRDFFVIEEDKDDPVCGCRVKEGGLSQEWREKIVKDTGKHYECLDDDSVPDLLTSVDGRDGSRSGSVAGGLRSSSSSANTNTNTNGETVAQKKEVLRTIDKLDLKAMK